MPLRMALAILAGAAMFRAWRQGASMAVPPLMTIREPRARE
jgi:hypothetical protein